MTSITFSVSGGLTFVECPGLALFYDSAQTGKTPKVAMVRKKYLENEIFSSSGKSQGI